MPVSTRELNEFLCHPSCARYVHTNLHLHTPATHWDWDSYPGQTTAASALTPAMYFDALASTSLELVAITDHNCVSWCASLIDLAKKARKAGKSRIHILPGVEITTYEGPHLIAIFDENQDVEELRHLLVQLGLSGEGGQKERAGGLLHKDTVTISTILDSVVDGLGGVAIAPHVHQKDGLWGSSEFRGRYTPLNDKRVRILAAPSGHIKRVVDSPSRVRLLYKNMDSSLIHNSYGFINVSDCHRLEDFELNATWMKMSTPSLNGVRQIIHEPELRIAHRVEHTKEKVDYPETIHFDQPTDPKHPYVIAVSVTGGMLNGQRLVFSPNQNSIIGKNYSGKSALLDCLRFSLDAVPLEEGLHDRFADRLRAFVGEGGEVRAYLQDQHGRIYGVSRTLACSHKRRSSKALLQIDGAPEIYQLLNNEFRRESDLSIKTVFPLEVYPQGEVVKIKDNALQQMRIVDALADVELSLQDLTDCESSGERTLCGKLADNSQRILAHIQRKNELAEEISGTTQLQQEINDLERLIKSPLFTLKSRWSDTAVMIDGYKKVLQRLQESWSPNSLLPPAKSADPRETEVDNSTCVMNADAFCEDSASPGEYDGQAKRGFLKATTTVREGVTSSRSALRNAIDMLSGLEVSRQIREDNVDQEIRENLSPDTEGKEEGGIIKRVEEKQKRLNDLTVRHNEYTTIEAELEALDKERAELLKQFHAKWQEILIARRNVVQVIDSQSATNIRAELKEHDDREQYRELLNEIAARLTNASNRIPNREGQLDAIVANTTPSQLIEIVREGNANRLTQIASEVTPNTARIVLGMGQGDIHKLEACVLGDRFVISYMKEGDEVFTPIDSGLSGGEQALALMSVAMVPKSLPLVIDQPEDELGPALITRELVEQIRRVKSGRQLIFVTHVPNIPVLADSEQVICVKQEFTDTGKASVIECCGSLDQRAIVMHLLELDGGDVAFQKRSERYSAAIGSGT